MLGYSDHLFGRWTFGFADLANVWFGFRFSHLKTAVFRFWGLPQLAGFLEFRFWFSVFSKMMAIFRVFCPVHFTVFLVSPRQLHPAVALKLT